MSYNKDQPPPYPVVPVFPLPMIPDLSHINDYLPWSIVNLFLGWGFFGVIPLVFSIVCRTNKSNNDLNGAQSMSTLALVFNILVTLIGIIGWTIFIIFMSIYITALHSLT
jgi:hypothetical protein